ncbi:MAG: PAS domain S-box protein [Xanthobacteraceae bacterium]
MLEQFSDQVRECYDCAAEAKARADTTNDPALKAEFLDAERRWLCLARSFGFAESLQDFTTENSERRRIFDERLEQSSALVAGVTKNLDGPDDILQLHEISTLLIQEGDLDSLYSRILDAAINLMASDMASMQVLDPERNYLRFVAWKGFHPQSAAFWESVYLDSASTCGLAFSSGCRVVVTDVETCDFMANTADLAEYRRSNIRAVQSTPLISRSGQLLGMISTHWRKAHEPRERDLRRLDVLARQAADLIERGKAEAALRESNEQLLRLASIVESSNDAIITMNLDGVISSWNQSAERLFGYTTEEVVGKPITIYIPPERHNEEPTILARLRRGERIDHYETVRQRKDGSAIDISLTVSPIKNVEGRIIGASKIARDITERKRNDEHIAILAREAEHRAKNIQATVQATVNLSQADTADGLKRAVEGRIRALANVHALFVKSRWSGAELSNIVTQEFAPYLREGEARIQIDGPHVLLPPNAAQAIAITLHELATNAAKYGSLSVAEGQVEVTWARMTDGRLIVHWTESGGPPTRKPTRAGFGTRVVERMIREQLKGEMHLDWRTEGLACEIVLKKLF